MRKLSGETTRGEYRILTIGFWALLITGLILLTTWHELPFHSCEDANWYMMMVEGNSEEVNRPFCNRILHPATVRALMDITHIGMDEAFRIISILALLLLTASITASLSASGVYPAWSFLLLFSPALLMLYKDHYLTDLFHASLLALLFFLLLKRKTWPSIVVLFLLCLSRESTLLLVLCIAVVGCLRKEWKLVAGSLLAALTGIVFTAIVVRGQPNIHGMNMFMYMLLKLPCNVLRNLFGIVPWTDTFATGTTFYPQEPIFRIAVPGFLPLGSIHKIGIYEIDLFKPLFVLRVFLTIFGTLPALLVYSLRKGMRQPGQKLPTWLSIAVAYGLIAFFLGAGMGTLPYRLILFGWPAFWIGAPLVLRNYCGIHGRKLFNILITSFTICWIPMLFGKVITNPTILEFTSLAGVIPFYYLTARILRVDLRCPRHVVQS